jgi:hypothetical protein
MDRLASPLRWLAKILSAKNKKPTSLSAVGQLRDQIELRDQLNEPAFTMPEDTCAPR